MASKFPAAIAMVLLWIIILISVSSSLSEVLGFGEVVGRVESDSDSHKYPFIVFMEINGSYSCGGSIISPDFILTSAYCPQPPNGSIYTVVAGSGLAGFDPHSDARSLPFVKGTEQRILVRNTTVHSGFNSTTHENDIALIKLVKPLTITLDVQPARLPRSGFTPDFNLTAISWDITMNHRSLRAFKVPFIDDDSCQKLFHEDHTKLYDSMLCSGHKDKVQDFIPGSGDPLISTNDKGVVTIIGISSFDLDVSNPGFPRVYTEVSFFRKWIVDTIKNSR